MATVNWFQTFFIMTKFYAFVPMFPRFHTDHMAAAGSSMMYSLFLFVATLSLQEMFRAKLASSELFTIFGGFTSSLIFLMLLTVRDLSPFIIYYIY